MLKLAQDLHEGEDYTFSYYLPKDIEKRAYLDLQKLALVGDLCLVCPWLLDLSQEMADLLHACFCGTPSGHTSDLREATVSLNLLVSITVRDQLQLPAASSKRTRLHMLEFSQMQ